jgi:hypothetical protein
MSVTVAAIEKLDKKFKNLDVKVVEKTEDGKKVDVFAITYQKNGLPGKLSEGLREANALWDESQSRPRGYIVAHGWDRGNGVSVSVLVSEEWLDKNKLSVHKQKWELEL